MMEEVREARLCSMRWRGRNRRMLGHKGYQKQAVLQRLVVRSKGSMEFPMMVMVDVLLGRRWWCMLSSMRGSRDPPWWSEYE